MKTGTRVAAFLAALRVRGLRSCRRVPGACAGRRTGLATFALQRYAGGYPLAGIQRDAALLDLAEHRQDPRVDTGAGIGIEQAFRDRSGGIGVVTTSRPTVSGTPPTWNVPSCGGLSRGTQASSISRRMRRRPASTRRRIGVCCWSETESPAWRYTCRIVAGNRRVDHAVRAVDLAPGGGALRPRRLRRGPSRFLPATGRDAATRSA